MNYQNYQEIGKRDKYLERNNLRELFLVLNTYIYKYYLKSEAGIKYWAVYRKV